MVKGRRMRGVVACLRDKDYCSPVLRRGRRIQAFDPPILQETKSNSLTAFFQSVQVEIVSKRCVVDDGFSIQPLEYSERDVTPSLFEDPAARSAFNSPITRKNDVAVNVGTPTTPHRIQLFPENGVKDEVKIDKEIIKVKKRMNNTLNQIKNNHKLTEYFPVRRSVRKTKTTVLEEKQRTLEQLVREGLEEGLEVCNFTEKGRGVIARKPFSKGDFVVEYSGDLIDLSEAKNREFKYAQDLNTGCYMYYFKHNNQQYCVDATAESGKLGRLVNHSRNGNLVTKTVSVDNKPRLVLLAKEDIGIGTELTYDYGDRSRESIKHHPWLAN